MGALVLFVPALALAGLPIAVLAGAFFYWWRGGIAECFRGKK